MGRSDFDHGMQWSWDVDYAEDKDALKRGETRSGTSRVNVLAHTHPEAMAMANEMLDSAPLVIGALKRLASEILPVGPVERMVAVSQTLGRVRASEDMQEGILAHKERRKPNFRGR